MELIRSSLLIVTLAAFMVGSTRVAWEMAKSFFTPETDRWEYRD